MTRVNHKLNRLLTEKGVLIDAPDATVIEDVDPDRVEAGVRLFPGCTVCGSRTLLRAGTELGRAGGGYFENVCAGRDAALFGGYYKDAVFLDGVIIRGHAEMRGGTLLEEGCEAAHHVGYKMTVMLPYVVAGSLVNFCDALVAGGTGRQDHSEIGSTLALYNFTPWSDKFASQFGDVPRGVFLRSPRIFVGGQTQIVSPVKVGYGTVLAAGTAVRRSVPDGRLYGEPLMAIDRDFDPAMYGGLLSKFNLTAEFIGNLYALALWYVRVRKVVDAEDHLQLLLYDEGLRQIEAGISERVKRLDKLVQRLPRSREKHRAALSTADENRKRHHRRRIAEHQALVAGWDEHRSALTALPEIDDTSALAQVADSLRSGREASREARYIDLLRQPIDDGIIKGAVGTLQRVIDSVVSKVEFNPPQGGVSS